MDENGEFYNAIFEVIFKELKDRVFVYYNFFFFKFQVSQSFF